MQAARRKLFPVTRKRFRLFACLVVLAGLAALASTSAGAEAKDADGTRLEARTRAEAVSPFWTPILPARGVQPTARPVQLRAPAAASSPRVVHMAGQTLVIEPDIQLHPNATTTQSEMTIWTHPIDPDIVFAGSNAVHVSTSVGSQGWYYTTDAGVTWTGGDTLPSHTDLSAFLADPSVGIDLDGNLFFNALWLGFNRDCFVARSTDQGASWTQTLVPDGNNGEDKNHMAIDVDPGSPYVNNIYTAYTQFDFYPSPLVFSRSTDRGVTFSSPVPISGTLGLEAAQGINLAVGPDGELYAAFSAYDFFPPDSSKLGFNKSTDGGATWQTAYNIRWIQDVRDNLVLDKGPYQVRVASFPSMAVDRSSGPRRGWVYIVYPARAPVTPDIFLIRSTDAGTTWSTPVRVNQDTTSNDQWYSWISVDPATGGIYVVYYDSRNFAANDSAQVYVSSSLDGGATFEDVLVSDVPFLPQPIAGLAAGYMGDYIGISALNGIVWPCWNDDRTGLHQGYTSRLISILPGTPPTINVSRDTLDFGDVYLGYPDTMALTVRNMGYPETLFVSNIQADDAHFTTDVTSLLLPGGNGQQVHVAFTPSATGPAAATLTLTSNDTVNPSLDVVLLANARLCPQIAVTPDSLRDTVFSGGSVIDTLFIFNIGSDVLDFDFPSLPPLVSAFAPTAGAVASGDSMLVEVTLTAHTPIGGTYTSEILIRSNDCDVPEVTVPVSVHVIRAADIELSLDSLDFGIAFTGATDSLILTVSNPGQDMLRVSDVTSDNPDFAVDTTNFLLVIYDFRDLIVTFTPSAIGISTGTLTITSDDPDEPTVTVSLVGEGADPPIIAVAPDSISDSLFTGETADHVITITNSGPSDLEFEITVEDLGGPLPVAPRFGRQGGHPLAPRIDLAAAENPWLLETSEEASDDQPLTATAPAADSSILVIQNTTAWGLDMATFIQDSFGIAPTVINSSQIVTTDFDPFGLIITVGDEASSYYAELGIHVAKFADYVAGGGVVQYQLATQGPNVVIAGGVDVIYGNPENTNRVLAPGHPIVAGLPTLLDGNYANHNYLTNLPPGALVITETEAGGNPTTVEYEIGRGHVIATGMTWEFLATRGFNSAPMLYNAVAYSLSLFGPGWIEAEPQAGTVPTGDTVEVTVRLDASGLYGGDYYADIIVTSNDPMSPEDTVHAHLNVTGAPDIALSVDTLAFDTIFIGYAGTQTVTVSNEGTDTLRVTDISSDHADYTPAATAFVLLPGEGRDVDVTFAPSSLGASSAVLTITSNDQDEATVTVALFGVGADAPVISVWPDSLSDSLFSGDSSKQSLYIANTGGSGLLWDIRAEAETMPQSYQLSPVSVTASDPDLAPSDPSGTVSGRTVVMGALDAALADLTDQVIGFTSMGSYSGLAADLQARGATVVNVVFPVSTMLLDTLDALAIDDNIEVASAADIDAIRTWMQAGGGLLLQGDNSASMTNLNAVLDGTGIVETAITGFPSAVLTDILPHPTTKDVDTINASAYGSYCTVTSPADRVVLDDSGRTHIAAGTLGRGRVIAAGNEVALNSNIDIGQTRLFANQVIDWLVAGVDWLRLDYSTGTTPAHDTDIVEVTFDATGLFGGTYHADLVVSSNDSLMPLDTVPATLHVTGVPLIAVSPDTLDYGVVFTSSSTADTLIVSNMGTDLLTVTGITSDNTDFTAGISAFALAPDAALAVAVTFTPNTPGPSAGTLTISSDAHNAPVLTVVLRGEAVPPPIISVTPDALGDTLFVDQASEQYLFISNTGVSDLLWDLLLETGAVGPLFELPAATVAVTDPDLPETDSTGQPASQQVALPGVTAELMDLTGLTVGFNSLSSHSSIVSDLQARGATTVEVYFPINLTLLDGLDALAVDDDISGASSGDIAAIRAWVQGGGGLLLEGDNSSSIAENDAVLAGTGISEISVSFTSALLTDIFPHPTTVDVDTINASAYGVWCNVSPPAETIVLDDLGRTHIAVSKLGSGRVMAAGNEVAYTSNFGIGQTRLFCNHVFDWLLGAVGWLTAEPDVGTTPAGQTDTVRVVFDATGLDADTTYYADLIVASNDPVTPQDTVPSQLTVLGPIALEVQFEGICPAGGTTIEGAAVAVQVNAVVDSAAFVSLDLVGVTLDGLLSVPTNAPVVTGLDRIETPNARSLILYWEPVAGEAGTWEFCFEIVTNNMGQTDTGCVAFDVTAPGPTVLRWQPQHFEYQPATPLPAAFKIDLVTSHDSTFAVVGPFRIRSTTSSGAFIGDPIDEGDGTFSAAMSVFEQQIDQNPVYANDAASPDSVLMGLIDIGGSALDPGTYAAAVSYATTIAPVEGIIAIDSTVLPPANRLRMNVSDNLEIVPSYGAGCYAVTMVRNIPPDTVYCPVSHVGPSVYGHLVQISGLSFHDPDDGPGPYTFKVVSIKNGGVDSTPANLPTWGPFDQFNWQTTATDQDVGLWEFCITVHDGVTDATDTCCFEVDVIGEVPLAQFAIGTVDSVFNGAQVCLPVMLHNQVSKSLGGFDLLITYDPTFLTFIDVVSPDHAGGALWDCDWEYFTYRLEGPNPSLIRLVAIADMNNSADHPDCYLEQGGELFRLCFRVTNDRNFGCLKTPIQFYWNDCGDNTASNKVGDTLYAITDPWDPAMPWFPSGLAWPGGGVRGDNTDDAVQLGTFAGGINGPPGPHGGMDVCDTFYVEFMGQPEHTIAVPYGCYPCVNHDPNKPGFDQNLGFVNGWIKIICPGDIDDRGDLNLNGFAYEIADAVLFSNYFIMGPAVFTTNLQGQIAAADINADGTPLTIADLVYLIRVITGDADPIGDDLLQGGAKVAAGRLEVTAVSQGAYLAVHTSSESDLGAGLFVFEYENAEIASVTATGRAAAMNVAYVAENGELRVLLFNIEDGAKVEAGAGEILAIVTTGGRIRLVEVEAASFAGGALESNVGAKVLPTSYALRQNYPNPFNAHTSLAIDLPQPSNYTLTIYNIAGQVVKRFAGRGEAGTVTIIWNSTDQRGAAVASGVYFYRAQAGGFAAVKKMVLMK